MSERKWRNRRALSMREMHEDRGTAIDTTPRTWPDEWGEMDECEDDVRPVVDRVDPTFWGLG